MANEDSEHDRFLRPVAAAANGPSKPEGWRIDWEEAEEPTREQFEQLDKKILESHKAYIKSVTEISLDYRPATVREVRIEKDRLLIAIDFPLLSSPAYSHLEHWPLSRKDIQRFRKFMMNGKNQKLLSSFFYQQLVRFLMGSFKVEKASNFLKEHIRKIPQQLLAGRPARAMSKQVSRYIVDEGGKIYSAICQMQRLVLDMKKRNGSSSHPIVQTKLQRKYPPTRYPWAPHFFKFAAKLPRKRYSSIQLAESDFSESASPTAKRLPCNLEEPENWSPLDITAVVLQDKLLSESGVRYPRHKIKDLIKS